MSTGFVHLHVHSEYSLADGIASIKDLVATAASQHMPAVAVTDVGNVFGLVKFYRAAVTAGVKPIVGVDVWIHNGADSHKPHRLVLLCQDLDGYRNLCRLLTRAYREGQLGGKPCLSRAWLAGHSDGLIALSGAEDGEIGQALLAGNRAVANQLAHEYAALFPERFYLMLQRIGQRYQEDSIHAAVELAQRCRLPVVATNHVCFLRPSDFEAHEVRVCIQEGRVLNDSRRPRCYTKLQYFRSAGEMAELFADIPEALENTVEIAKRCNLRLEFGRYFLPDYPVPAGMTIDEMLRQHAAEGLQARLERQSTLAPERRELYHTRLQHELDVITTMGFSGYFLIVADFIKWAKKNGVPVGPGRGSGAGSLVAYSLSITDLDPIEHDLLFERFLNPERVSLPDFDVDFCIEGRDRVIDYVTRRYGENRVSQIITYGTMAARAVVRDVGRVMDHPYGYVDKLAKLIPFEIGVTLDRALQQEPVLRERYQQEEDVRALLDTAQALEGLPRNAGKHAGGVVIAPSMLTDFMPLYCEQGGKQLVTQFDKDDLEALGLVKFDFLGLRNLTTIDKAVK
ncbi:MAG: DNA polymerase III subunit alpha, partial [Acidiferrobacterales bacterium]